MPCWVDHLPFAPDDLDLESMPLNTFPRFLIRCMAGSLLVCLGLAQTALAGQGLTQARIWAAACANCHGTNGRAQTGMEPLAGQSQEALVRKMSEFKSGQRPATVMHQIAKGYSDEQIQAIASWFAAQPH